MPSCQWARTDFEKKLHKSVAIKLGYALALAAQVQENSFYLRSPFGMHGGKVRHTDYAHNVPLLNPATACIYWLEVKRGHLA